MRCSVMEKLFIIVTENKKMFSAIDHISTLAIKFSSNISNKSNDQRSRPGV